MYKKRRFPSIFYSIASLVAILLLGELGYILIEGYSLLDAFFMTMITVSTVGFGEVKPLSPNGEIFTIVLIVSSFGVYAYAVTSITRFIIDGGFRHYFSNRKMQRKVQRIAGHVIVCGFGRNGSEVAKMLQAQGEKFLVVEDNTEVLERIQMQHRYLVVEGDATDDKVLLAAGLHRAKALITTLPNDAENLLIVLSARSLSKDVRIISRASHEWSDIKLKHAGANNVLMPDLVGGRRMAKLVATPNVMEFLRFMMKQQVGGTVLKELSCSEIAESFLQKPIGDLKFKRIAGVSLIGIKNTEGNYEFNPPPDMMLTCGHKLFVMGTQEQISKLKSALFTI